MLNADALSERLRTDGEMRAGGTRDEAVREGHGVLCDVEG